MILIKAFLFIILAVFFINVYRVIIFFLKNMNNKDKQKNMKKDTGVNSSKKIIELNKDQYKVE